MDSQLKEPLVSVVLTTYNRSRYLEQALYSIAKQTYLNVEILLIDDGSGADIAEQNKIICDLFSNCSYYYKPNTGQPDSRNYGINRSKGTYIAFCDDDDFWLKDKLEHQVAILNNHPEVGLVTGNIEFVKSDGIRTGRVIKQTGNHGYVFEEFLLKNRTSSITPVLRKSVFDEVGYFNPDFTISEDWEFWRRVAYKYKFYALPKVLACVRKHENNMMLNISKKPFEQYKHYKKVTEALMEWGGNRFSKKDLDLIHRVAIKKNKQILQNHCPGIFNKLKLFIRIVVNDIRDVPMIMALLIHYKNE